MAGPLLASFILWRAPNGYGIVFALSIAAAFRGLLIFVCFVDAPGKGSCGRIRFTRFPNLIRVSSS